MGDDIISISYVCYFPITMVLYHCHHCWLLFFVDLHCYLPMDNFNHSLVSLTTVNVPCWAILLELFIIFVFLPELCCRIIVPVDDCYCMSFFFLFSLLMSVTTWFYSFCLFPLHGWVIPLIMITDYVWCTLGVDHISTIYP